MNWVLVGFLSLLVAGFLFGWRVLAERRAREAAAEALATHEAGLRGEVTMWTYNGWDYWWQEDWDGTHLYKVKDYPTGQYGPPVSEAEKRRNQAGRMLGAVAIIAAGGAVLTWIGGSVWVVLPGIGIGMIGWLVVIGIEAKRMRDYSRRDWSKR